MTVFTVLGVVAGIAIPSLIKSGGSSGPTRIALVGSEAQALAPDLARTARAAKVNVKLSDVPDDQATDRFCQLWFVDDDITEVWATQYAGLGEAFSAAFLKLKTQEWNSFARHLTQWERDNTLDA